MKNEALARAITMIDDDLVASARETAAGKHKSAHLSRYMAAAACLVLILGAALLSRFAGGVDISVYGSELSASPITIEIPAPLSPEPRLTAPDSITVPIEADAYGKLAIEAAYGTVEVYSASTGKLLSSGQSCEVRGSAVILWTVEKPQTGRAYTLSINKDAAVLLLSYDESTNNWILNRQ